MKKLALPVQLGLVIGLVLLGGHLINHTVVSLFYTVSSLTKELLEFMLPAIVFFFITDGIIAFGKRSFAIIGLLLSVIFCSNFITSFYAFTIGELIVSRITPGAVSLQAGYGNTVQALYSFNLPVWIKSEQAMLAALVCGISLSFFKRTTIHQGITRGKKTIEWGLSHLFIPVLPLYVAGFFLKMSHEISLFSLCGVYGIIFLCAVIMQLTIVSCAYFIANGFSYRRAFTSFTRAFPSYMTALGTMSSIATLPVSVETAVENCKNRPLAQFAMPILANVHLMGDAVAVPLFCLATMQLFLGTLPAFSVYLLFACYFCVTMLAVSGIPGGGIIVMLPLLKSLFGFTPEMLGVITALYLLHDGFGTASNVMGDGAIVIGVNKLAKKLGIQAS